MIHKSPSGHPCPAVGASFSPNSFCNAFGCSKSINYTLLWYTRLCLNVSDRFGSKKLKSDSLIRYKGNLLKYSVDLLGTLIFSFF